MTGLEYQNGETGVTKHQKSPDEREKEKIPDESEGGVSGCCSRTFPGGYWPECKRTASMAWPLVSHCTLHHTHLAFRKAGYSEKDQEAQQYKE